MLTLYLRPSPSDPVLLEPALDLVAKHAPHLDSTATLDLLPPLVTIAEVQAFFVQTLRDGRAKANQRKVVEGLISARKEELDRVLMRLQMKRVRVTDQRMYVAHNVPPDTETKLTMRQMSAVPEAAWSVRDRGARTTVGPNVGAWSWPWLTMYAEAR